MQLALVDNERVEAFSGGRGLCPTCGSDVIAKRGPRVLHHWAHHRPRDCDPWWENETPWHREWKNLFPIECREVSHTADDGEIHRADIKTPTGIVIEVQHSQMSDAERESREQFYENLVWVVDGSRFRNNFHVLHKLPRPESEVAADIVWAEGKWTEQGSRHGLFFRLSEARESDPDIEKAQVRSGLIHSIQEIDEHVRDEYRGHHQYHWARPRNTWLEASCPVYLDLGSEHLFKLLTYDDSGLKCIQLVSKRKFVHDVMVESRAVDIATAYYPIAEE